MKGNAQDLEADAKTRLFTCTYALPFSKSCMSLSQHMRLGLGSLMLR